MKAGRQVGRLCVLRVVKPPENGGDRLLPGGSLTRIVSQLFASHHTPPSSSSMLLSLQLCV